MYRRADPTFTNWKPKTAYEAVDRFTRCQRNGLKSIMIPECLIECSASLPEPELDKFEEWIINPQGLDFSKAVPDDSIRKHNEEIFKTNLERDEVPPLPPVDEDEKMPEVGLLTRNKTLSLVDQKSTQDDEKVAEIVTVQPLGNGEALVGPVSSELAALAVCGML